jgi:hypothetical protein
VRLARHAQLSTHIIRTRRTREYLSKCVDVRLSRPGTNAQPLLPAPCAARWNSRIFRRRHIRERQSIFQVTLAYILGTRVTLAQYTKFLAIHLVCNRC